MNVASFACVNGKYGTLPVETAKSESLTSVTGYSYSKIPPCVF